jgi:tetratricopeptide (TPR) repeat protein
METTSPHRTSLLALGDDDLRVSLVKNPICMNPFLCRGLIFLSCIGFGLYAEAQESMAADSLKKNLQTVFGKNRLPLLKELHMNYRTTQFDSAMLYADLFNDLALSLADSFEIVQGGRMQAYSLMDLSKNEEAIKVLLRILGIAKRNQEKHATMKKQIKFILNNTGIAYMQIGNYDKALNMHYQSLIMREEEGDKKSIRAALNNIGLVFFNLNDYERSIEYYLKAVKISEELRDFSDQERLFSNLGLCYNQLGKFDEAIKTFQEGFKICNKECDDNIVKEGLEGLGIAYLARHDLPLAKENFLKSLDISRRQNDIRYISENLYSLGKIEIELKNEKQGLAYLTQAESLVESVNLAEGKLSVYKELADYYSQRNDYQKSLFYQKKYTLFKDSIYNDKLIKNITKIQTQYDQRENVKTIAEKNQILLLKDELLEKQKLQTFLMGSIAVLLLILMVAVYKNYRDRLLINAKLDHKVKERTEELREVNTSLTRANEQRESVFQKITQDNQKIVLAIQGLCHTAQLDLTDEKAKEYMHLVEKSLNKLTLQFSKIENER